MNIAVSIQNLQKSYGEHAVLKGISFNVVQGEIFALLGTNGAGKTTTLECIEGLRTYTSGQISLKGKIGVQLQSSSLPAHIKASEALTLFSKWNATSINLEFANPMGLETIKNKPYMELSTGQKRRLHLLLAMIGNPDILLLDEPTAGLDVEARVALHNEIRLLKEQGKTIILSSHDMAEVESLCDRMAILKDGHIAFLGTVHELTAQIQTTFRIQLKLSSSALFDSLLLSSFLGEQQGYHVFEADDIQNGLYEILTQVREKNIRIYDLKLDHISLEQRFMEIAKGGKV